MRLNKIQNIIQLTDIHGKITYLKEISNELQSADLILISGDITHFGRRKDAEVIINAIREYNSSILAVSGNCDYPEIEEYLSESDINLHLTIRELSGYIFTGISGSIPCPGKTPFEYPDDQAETWLDNITEKLSDEFPLMFVSHQPPINTVNDSIPGGLHVGSKSIYNFIYNAQPLICFTGHIHEGIGIDSIGQTRIINPGPFRAGKYAKIEIRDNNHVEVILKQVTATV